MNKAININGVGVRYIRDCVSNSPLEVLVFLHGWGGSSQSWGPNIQELSQTFDYIAVDLPGFGVSDEPDKVWGVAEYAEFVRNFIQALGLLTFTLVGKSFGGRIAIFYASEYPQDLSYLILVAAVGTEGKSFSAQVKVVLAKTGKMVFSLLGSKVVEKLRPLYYKAAKVTRDSSDYKWEVKKVATNTNLVDVVEHITTPTLIIWGKDDNVLPLRVGKELNRRIKGSKLCLIPGGHNAHQESAQRFDSLITDYLT